MRGLTWPEGQGFIHRCWRENVTSFFCLFHAASNVTTPPAINAEIARFAHFDELLRTLALSVGFGWFRLVSVTFGHSSAAWWGGKLLAGYDQIRDPRRRNLTGIWRNLEELGGIASPRKLLAGYLPVATK